MQVLVTGGSGFIGRALCRQLMAAGHQVTVLSRSQEAAARLPQGARAIIGDPSRQGDWQAQAAEHQGFINLAGASIFGRWSPDYKALLRSSRVLTTRNLVEAMAKAAGPKVLVSASAVGYYGFHQDEELDESSPAGQDFLGQLCLDWEAEANAAARRGARVVATRFGIVLGKGGGALGQMLPLFKLGLGGVLGSGRQWFSWIHRADLVSAIVFCLERELAGAVNCTAPRPVTNRELTQALAHAVHRPAFLPAPAFAVKLLLGELGSVLLEGQRVLPRRIMRAGFQFKFPTIETALEDLLG
ncbi:MAG: TIGR01777 family protein [Desulfarculus sp.]|nr:MAG: TIGR01777 family protein [Desulfarculus sp.]